MNIKLALFLCIISFITIIANGAKPWQLGAFFVIVFSSYLVYKKRHN